METDVTNTTTTQLDAGVPDVLVSQKAIDEASSLKETWWTNPFWTRNLGYFKQIPEFKEPLRALARWTVGKGFVTDNRTQVITDNIIGWGEDSFQSILTDMIIVKKVNGDSFAEIIRSEDGTLLNLKKLNPSQVRIVVSPKGIIKRYDEMDAKRQNVLRPILTQNMLHLCNDRMANEIHGTSAIDACKWELDAKKEASEDWRRISHRSTIRVMYIDADDDTRLGVVREQYKEAIKNGEVLIIPAKKGEAELQDITVPPIQPFIEWIRYLDTRIYQSLGVPKIIADTSDFTEAASKVGYMTFEPVYVEEQTLLEQDLWNQLAIRVKFNRPPSLSGVVQEDEQKNTGQTGIQQNEVEVTPQRTE